MDVRTYRAASIQDALRLVWQDLGPDAAVLHTREVSRGLLAWFSGVLCQEQGGIGRGEVERFVARFFPPVAKRPMFDTRPGSVGATQQKFGDLHISRRFGETWIEGPKDIQPKHATTNRVKFYFD